MHAYRKAPWPGWSLALALSFDCYLTLFHWGFRSWLLYRGKVFGGETEAISSCSGPNPPAAGMVATAGCSRLLFPARSRHKVQLLREISPFLPHQSTQLSLGARSSQSLGSSQPLEGHPAVLVPASPDVGWKEWLWHLLSRLKFGSRMPVCYLCRTDMSLCPEPCGPDSSPCIYKTLLMCPLLLQVLDSNGITHMCTHTQALQSRGKSSCLQLIDTTTLEMKIWQPNRKEKEDQPDTSSVFSFHIPISSVTGAACRKVCSPLPSGHCCLLGVKMRKQFCLGDLLLSSCCICKAHH